MIFLSNYSVSLTRPGSMRKHWLLLRLRKFQPWEGGEALVPTKHVRTHLALGRRALFAGDAIGARVLHPC